MSDEFTEFDRRRCSRKRGCGCEGESGGGTSNTMSIDQRMITPEYIDLEGNRRGINVTIARWANAPFVMAQFEGFTGVMNRTVPALIINMPLQHPPIHSLVNVTAMVNDGSAMPGILKVGGACNMRVYKLAGYLGGATNRFADRRRAGCNAVFRQGEEVSMQGTSLVWITGDSGLIRIR